MNKLIRLFNQNIGKIISSLLVIIFIFAIINILNEVSKVNNRNKNNEQNVISNNNEKNYEKESTSLITGEKVSDTYQDTFGKLIDKFLYLCSNGEFEEAYEMLSKDCKEELYPSSNNFKDKYCKDKFKEKRKYSFQLWSANEPYIYKVKIFEDMLSSGKVNNSYIEDYYTIVNEDGEYKLNISSFVGKIDKDSIKTANGIDIKIKNIKVYLNYLIYTLEVKNNTDTSILLDSKKKNNETYLQDRSGAVYPALLHENTNEDLLIKANQEKEVKIKFSCIYQESTKLYGLVFSKVISNYEQYKQNAEKYEDFYQIEIEQ